MTVEATEHHASGANRNGVPANNHSRVPRNRLTTEEHLKLSRRYKVKRAFRGYAFIAPNFIFFFIFMIFPIIWVFWFSLRSGGIIGSTEYVGISNWTAAFQDPLALKALRNSLLYALIAIPAMLIIGLGIASFLRNIIKGGSVLRAGIYLPTLAPIVVAGLIWVFMVHPDFGALNMIIRSITGEPVVFLGNSTLALPTIAAVEVWRGIGFWSVFFLAALMGLPSELYEAAHLDGSNTFQRFYYITLPLLRPTILFGLVLATIYNLQIFDTVFVMTDGGPAFSTATIVWYIYKTLFTYGNVGYGATLSIVLLIIILILTLIMMRLLRGRKLS